MTTDNGSDVVRALWQRESASSFSMEPDEIQRKLSRIQAELRDVTIIVYVLCTGMAIWFAYFLVFTTQPIVTRAGLFLIVLAMTFWVGHIWLYNRDGRKALLNSVAAGQTNCVEFYRAELVRQRDFNRGGWLWSRTLALFAGLFLGGWEPLHHWRGNGNAPRAVNLLVVSILAILTVWLSYRKSRKLQQQIDAIEAMRRPNGGGRPALGVRDVQSAPTCRGGSSGLLDNLVSWRVPIGSRKNLQRSISGGQQAEIANRFSQLGFCRRPAHPEWIERRTREFS